MKHGTLPIVRACTSSQAIRLLALAAFAWTLLSVGVSAQARARLESFYVTFSNSTIVHVEAVDAGVKVRLIHIDVHDDFCGTRVVRAYEVVVPSTTVEALAGTAICALSERRVDRAVERSREAFMRTRDGIPSGPPFDAVVATCGGREQRFVFDYFSKPGIDEAALKRLDSEAHALFTVGERLVARVSGSAPGVATQEALGTAAAADLLAGKYDGAYRDMCVDENGKRTGCSPAFWTQVLGGYTGPPEQRGPLPVELVDRSSWQFVRYVPPLFPPIALSARIFRDVRLRLEVERVTGAVTQAAVVEGHALLNDAALTAARQWRFVPGTNPADPFEVTLRFELRCPAR
jgi:TonB family protein